MLKKLFFISSVILLLASCNCEDSCPLDPSFQAFPVCNIRDASIHEFVPEQGDNNVVHGIVFPFNSSEEAFLLKDSRFADGQIYTLFEPFTFMFNDEQVFVAVTDDYPTNESMVNDIIVTSITDPRGGGSGNTPTATIRIKGSIIRFNDTFLSTSSTEYKDFLESLNPNDLGDATQNLSQYGEDEPNANVITYSTAEARVFDAEGELLNPQPTIPAGILNQVQEKLEEEEYEAVDLTIQEGDVYIYRAQNGRDFMMVIKEIRIDRTGNKRIIDIMFDELR